MAILITICVPERMPAIAAHISETRDNDNGNNGAHDRNNNTLVANSENTVWPFNSA